MAHRGVNLLADHPIDLEDDAPVVEQQHVARAHVLGQVLVVEADAFLVAELAARVEDEVIAVLEKDLAFLELADADLRALQVGEDADRTADLGRDLADAVGPPNVVFGAAVREVEAHDVDAGADQRFEDERIARRGAEGGNDLGMTGHGHPLLAGREFDDSGIHKIANSGCF